MSDEELRELDKWIYRNVPGMKKCSCVDWIQPKFGKTEYAKIRHIFLTQGSKDAWPEIEPDLPCNHESHPTTDSAAAMGVLKKCVKELGDSMMAGEFMQWSGDSKITIMSGNDCQATAETIELCICLFAKKLFSKTL